MPSLSGRTVLAWQRLAILLSVSVPRVATELSASSAGLAEVGWDYLLHIENMPQILSLELAGLKLGCGYIDSNQMSKSECKLQLTQQPFVAL